MEIVVILQMAAAVAAVEEEPKEEMEVLLEVVDRVEVAVIEVRVDIDLIY
jgi:hypothetical protein